jgi:hypothetical protein
MDERRLEGGFDGGATVVDGTVRRVAGPWTPSVRKVLAHLLDRGFDGAPRPLGADELVATLSATCLVRRSAVVARGRHGLTATRPWRRLPGGCAGFTRRSSTSIQGSKPCGGRVVSVPGLVIGHNDAAPYNAVWDDDGLVGFVDWDMCGPLARESDLAWVAFSWVPLHARDVVEAEGFIHFSDRRRRLELFLREYGSNRTADGLLEVLRRRLRENIDAMRVTARSGDVTYQRMLEHGVDRRLVLAFEGLDEV